MLCAFCAYVMYRTSESSTPGDTADRPACHPPRRPRCLHSPGSHALVSYPLAPTDPSSNLDR
ncbi:hypothetical protein GCM10010193_65000 [Kitasatospora atroaurantiaca]